jgi:hypothetical protein
MPTTTFIGPTPRSQQVIDEVKAFRQRVDSSSQPDNIQQSNRFNALTSLSNQPKPLKRSLSLFFFRKGSNKATSHGSPMVIELVKSTRITNWQSYLSEQVQAHPAWK